MLFKQIKRNTQATKPRPGERDLKFWHWLKSVMPVIRLAPGGMPLAHLCCRRRRRPETLYHVCLKIFEEERCPAVCTDPRARQFTRREKFLLCKGGVATREQPFVELMLIICVCWLNDSVAAVVLSS